MKADEIKRERMDILEQRQLMKKEIDRQKFDMMEKIDKVKQGKMDPNILLKTIAKDQSIGIIQTDNNKSI